MLDTPGARLVEQGALWGGGTARDGESFSSVSRITDEAKPVIGVVRFSVQLF